MASHRYAEADWSLPTATLALQFGVHPVTIWRNRPRKCDHRRFNAGQPARIMPDGIDWTKTNHRLSKIHKISPNTFAKWRAALSACPRCGK